MSWRAIEILNRERLNLDQLEVERTLGEISIRMPPGWSSLADESAAG